MCLFLQLPVLICFREGQIFTPSQNNSLFFPEQLLLGGTNTGKKKTKQLLDQKSGDGENLPPTPLYHPLGQDQAEKLYGAHRRDMDTETCYRPPDRLLIVSSKPHRTRKNKKQKPLQFHIYIQPKTFYIYGFVIFAEVHARTSRGQGSGRYRWRVEKGLRRQQLAWEPLDRSTRGEGGRIDFINKLSQHS